MGTLVKWLKSEGDEVSSGDMIAEVETDKATMEVENFEDGVVLKIFAQEGEQVEIEPPFAQLAKPVKTCRKLSTTPAAAAAPAKEEPAPATPVPAAPE